MFKMEINTDGSAFRDEYDNIDEYGSEVMRILRQVANTIEFCSSRSGKIIDINGNAVGSWSYTDD